MTKPTPVKIAAEIATLRAMQPLVRRADPGNANCAAMEAQISVLAHAPSEAAIYADYRSDSDVNQFLLDCALAARRWLVEERAARPHQRWEQFTR